MLSEKEVRDLLDELEDAMCTVSGRVSDTHVMHLSGIATGLFLSLGEDASAGHALSVQVLTEIRQKVAEFKLEDR